LDSKPETTKNQPGATWGEKKTRNRVETFVGGGCPPKGKNPPKKIQGKPKKREKFLLVALKRGTKRKKGMGVYPNFGDPVLTRGVTRSPGGELDAKKKKIKRGHTTPEDFPVFERTEKTP